MGIGGISGGAFGLLRQAGGGAYSSFEYRSVYEADPGAIIRKEEDRIEAKSHYTEDDALWNQYMKQYRDSLKITDKKLVVQGDPRSVLLGKVSEKELESFRQKVEKEGIGDEIDWRGLESDFRHMEISFENAGYLNTKVDYIASRYAVLKDRIENSYVGEEKEQQMEKLNQILDRTKKELLDSYADSVGEFYEEFGGSGTKKELKDSLSKGIDNRIAGYEKHLKQSETYAALGDNTDRWLRQDDGYMAARLREDFEAYGSAAGKDVKDNSEGEYTLHDLETAGVYAQECRSRLKEQGTFWSDNEERIGLDLAVQGMKTEYLAEHGKLSRNMQTLLLSAFDNYKKGYTDILEQGLKERAKAFPTQLKTSVDRDRISAVYQYTMSQYRQSKDMMAAFAKGAKQAQALFDKQSGNYSARYEWNHFFDQSQYTNIKGEDCMYGKYEKSISRFQQSLEQGDGGKLHLLFGSSGDYELNLFL